MDLFQHAKEAYIAELERRNELRRALSLPIGLSVVLTGALFSLFKGLPFSSAVAITIAFTAFWSLGLLSLAVGVFYLIRSHIGYEYAYMPTPQELYSFRAKLAEYYETTEIEGCPDTEVAEYMTGEYAKNSHHNALNNNTKSSRLYRANLWLVVTLVFTGLSGVVLLLTDLWGSS